MSVKGRFIDFFLGSLCAFYCYGKKAEDLMQGHSLSLSWEREYHPFVQEYISGPTLPNYAKGKKDKLIKANKFMPN